jgi:hypothetical protein
MAETDRRAYGSGGEPPLTLDERRAPRSRRPAPVTLILSLVVLLLAGGAVVWLYRSGLRGANDAPQPVGAPLRDVRVAAPPQPQAPDASAGLSIYKDNPQGQAAAPKFAPAPEEPAPRPTEVATAKPPAPPVSAAPAEQATATAPKAAAGGHGDPLGALIDRTTQAPAKVQKVAQATTGAAEVQIGAFSSQAQADEGWSAAAAAAPGAMAGRGKKVVPLDRDGSTLYRTSITGFASRDAAQALCDRLKAAGRTCFVR